MSNDADFYCKEHNYYWTVNAYSVAVSGQECKYCKADKLRNKFKKSYEEVKAMIENDGSILLSKTYERSGAIIEVKCPEGHIYYPTFNSFQQGHRCNTCQHEKVNAMKRKDNEDLLFELKNYGLEIVENITPIKNRNDTKLKLKCSEGHIFDRTIRTLMKTKRCPECLAIEQSIRLRGSNGPNWQGGKTEIRDPLRRSTNLWKKRSMESCDYQCVLTGSKKFKIHHLHPFNKILSEALSELGLDKSKQVCDYSEEEFILLGNKVLELHDKYPLGVCIRKDLHDLFHHIYGYLNCTPEDFEQFKQDYFNGKFSDLIE